MPQQLVRQRQHQTTLRFGTKTQSSNRTAPICKWGEKGDSGELGDDEQVTDDQFRGLLKLLKFRQQLVKVPKIVSDCKQIKAQQQPPVSKLVAIVATNSKKLPGVLEQCRCSGSLWGGQ